MAMLASDIERLIKAGIPDARVTIRDLAGDGDHYDTVLNFCIPKMGRRIFASKAMNGARPSFAMAKGRKVADRLVLVGVDTIKNAIFDRLQRATASLGLPDLHVMGSSGGVIDIAEALRMPKARSTSRACGARSRMKNCHTHSTISRETTKTSA